MRTHFDTTTGAKFVAVLLVVALLLTVFVVAPRTASQQEQYKSKRIFGQVVFPGDPTGTLPPATITFCKANGWGIELSIPGGETQYFTDTSKATWYAGVIKSITDQGIPVWLEIEGPIYYSSKVSVQTTPEQYQSLYGPGLAIYEKLGPLFKGYSFEGGYDNAIIWLKAHSERKLVAHWIAGWWSGKNDVIPKWGTHDMAWRVNQFDEIMWEVYQVDWCQSAVQFKQWLDTVAPSKPFGILSGWQATGGHWWNQYTHNNGVEYTSAQQKALLTQWLPWLKTQIGPFDGIICDPGSSSLSPVAVCTYMDSLT
jgi:hypothetical protein